MEDSRLHCRTGIANDVRIDSAEFDGFKTGKKLLQGFLPECLESLEGFLSDCLDDQWRE